MKKYILTVLSVFMALSFFLFAGTLRTDADIEISWEFEEKIYSNVTIDDDFDDSSVLVVMDKRVGGVNKVHKESFFGNFPKEYVKDLTEITVDIEEALINIDDFRQILEIKLPEGSSKENVLNVIQQLEEIEGIKYAGPNYFYYPASTTPNDPYWLLGHQWGLMKINAPAAWDITTGSSNVRVGIIDTGIAYHDDLYANVVPGWSFNGFGTNDTFYHGTYIAGIIGAFGNNNEGISGVNWNVSLVPLKFATGVKPYGSINGGRSTEAISAINYAKNNNISIINFSWITDNDNSLLTAIRGYSGLFVCAAGNENKNINSNASPIYPASWSGNNIITVGASNSDDTLWINPAPNAPANDKGSNYGSNAVDLFAPGGLDLNPSSPTYGRGNPTTDNTSSWYVYPSATSYAAPYVAGVAALIKAMHPGMHASTIKRVILENVDVKPGLIGYCVTGGRLNAYSALSAAIAAINDVSAYFAGYTVTISSHESGMYVDVLPPIGIVNAGSGSPVTFTVSGMTDDGYVGIKFNSAYFSVVPNTDGGNGIYHPVAANVFGVGEDQKFRIESRPYGGYYIVSKMTGFPIFTDSQMGYSIFTPSTDWVAGPGAAWLYFASFAPFAGFDINYYP